MLQQFKPDKQSLPWFCIPWAHPGHSSDHCPEQLLSVKNQVLYLQKAPTLFLVFSKPQHREIEYTEHSWAPPAHPSNSEFTACYPLCLHPSKGKTKGELYMQSHRKDPVSPTYKKIKEFSCKCNTILQVHMWLTSSTNNPLQFTINSPLSCKIEQLSRLVY